MSHQDRQEAIVEARRLLAGMEGAAGPLRALDGLAGPCSRQESEGSSVPNGAPLLSAPDGPALAEKMASVVGQVCARYARAGRVVGLTAGDLANEGWIAALDASPRWDGSLGVEYGAYLNRAVSYAVSRSVLRASSPVPTSHRPRAAIDTRRVPLHVESPGHMEEGQEGSWVFASPHLHREPSQEQKLDIARLRAGIRARVEALFPRLGESITELVAGLATPSEWAAEHSTGSKQGEAVRNAALKRLREDRELRVLWERTT